MNYESLIKTWIESDETRYSALKLASKLHLDDWCLSAGFVRNLVWDKLHKKKTSTPLNDLDLIYFNSNDLLRETDKQIESKLNCELPVGWSVKNQARMHIRNKDLPYLSTSDAMSFWPEVETAIGVKLNEHGNVEFIAPFGFTALFNKTITINNKCRKPNVFFNRIQSKNWLELWPDLSINT